MFVQIYILRCYNSQEKLYRTTGTKKGVHFEEAKPVLGNYLEQREVVLRNFKDFQETEMCVELLQNMPKTHIQDLILFLRLKSCFVLWPTSGTRAPISTSIHENSRKIAANKQQKTTKKQDVVVAVNSRGNDWWCIFGGWSLGYYS